MKTFFAISALAALLSLDSVSAMKSYLQKFPNGDLAFTQSLGHVSDTDTSLNDFGKLYSSKGDWASMCKETFPGASFTVGAAFGDPCCTWTSGGKPDFTVTPFTTSPKETTCASSAAATTAPASTTATPAATTSTPSSGSSSSSTPATTTAAPSSATPTAKKCGVKREANKTASPQDDDSGSDDA